MSKPDTRFKKGQSGNPNGRPKESPEVSEARKLTAAEYTLIATKYLMMTSPDIIKDLARLDANQLELIVGGIIAKAAKEKDERLATFVLDRVIGRVPAVLDANIKAEASLHMQLVKAMAKLEEAS